MYMLCKSFVLYFLYVLVYAAVPNITCPANFCIEETDDITRNIEASALLPVEVTHIPPIGSSMETLTNSTVLVTWSVNGSDVGLSFDQNVTVTWVVAYVGMECTGVSSEPSVLMNCASIPTADKCTTEIFKVSKLP